MGPSENEFDTPALQLHSPFFNAQPQKSDLDQKNTRSAPQVSLLKIILHIQQQPQNHSAMLNRGSFKNPSFFEPYVLQSSEEVLSTSLP